MKQRTPAQVMLDVADAAYWFGARRSTIGDIDKPGAYYDRLPQETKDILKNLKSEDISNQVLSALLQCGQPESPASRIRNFRV